jgi:hypothetical protein
MLQPLAVERLDLCCPARYRIVVQAVLDPARAAWFGDLELRVIDNTTTLTGIVADQAALHGLLAKVRDLGVPLLEVRWMDASPATYSMSDA